MSGLLAYLTVLTATMCLFNIGFVVGAIFEWKHVVLGWVITYTLLISMRSVVFLAVGILCIMVPTCNSLLGVGSLSAAYLPMALHSFFVMVVHGYFRFLEPVIRHMPVIIISKRGESVKKESPRRITDKHPSVKLSPSRRGHRGTSGGRSVRIDSTPKADTNNPTPKRDSNNPTPKAHTNNPTRKAVINKPSPKVHTNYPTPIADTNKPSPKVDTNNPKTKAVTKKPSPKIDSKKPSLKK